MTDPHVLARVAEAVDRLEDRVHGYLTLDDVRSAVGDDAAVDVALAEDLLLVDDRERLETTAWDVHPVTFCRLNRHHSVAKALRDARR